MKQHLCAMRRMKQCVALGSTLLIVLSGCGSAPPQPPAATSQAHAAATAAPPTSAPTTAQTLMPQRIDVGGHRLALYCSGAGSPTVILESGLGGDHTTWEQVQPTIAQGTRVCSYDRAGLGQSEAGTPPYTSEQTANDLHTLLTKAGVTPPYLLVGHSFGGLHIREYAHLFPDDVRGMVFVDAVHEDWWSAAAALLPPPSPQDNQRLQSFRAYLDQGYRDPASNDEGVDIPASVAQVKQSDTFGDMPIIVLTAEQFTVLAPGLPHDVEAKLKTLFQDDLQGRLARLSSNSTRVVAANSGHDMPRDNPQIIVTAVRALLAASR